MTRIPEVLLPWIHSGELVFWHNTIQAIIPSTGTPITATVRPPTGYIYIVFGLTFGTPRNYATAAVYYSTDVAFWHTHAQMKWHWDPYVESIVNFDYPQWLIVTKGAPITYTTKNATGVTISIDITTWLFQVSEADWENKIKPYLESIRNFYLKQK